MRVYTSELIDVQLTQTVAIVLGPHHVSPYMDSFCGSIEACLQPTPTSATKFAKVAWIRDTTVQAWRSRWRPRCSSEYSMKYTLPMAENYPYHYS
jgi:Na+-translocating ferredoxin:NAD+ oxidoreductase RNF subunit RnfB